MIVPVRLQLSRRRGFDLQAWSLQVNGLPAVSVARPSKHGNPYKIGPAMTCNGVAIPALDAAGAVQCFHEAWEAALRGGSGDIRRELLIDLRAHNLACWCDLCAEHQVNGKPLGVRCEACAPCHADVLLELANR